MLFKLDFLFVPLYAEWAEKVAFKIDNVPIDLGGRLDWELNFGRSPDMSSERPSIILRQGEGDIMVDESSSSDGIITFRFRPVKFREANAMLYHIALNYREDGVLKPFAIGTAQTVALVSS